MNSVPVEQTDKGRKGPQQNVPVHKVHSRLISLDAFRGLVMVLLVSDGFGLPETAQRFGSNAPGWVTSLSKQLTHAPWSGWTLWDLIHPAFVFSVGMSMSFAYASRVAKGESETVMARRALRRVFLLCLIGVFTAQKFFNFHFFDILTQIGLGYLFAFLLLQKSIKTRLIACATIFALYWSLFALYPAPPPNFDYATVGVPANARMFTLFWAHWNMNTNVGAAIDSWLLNLIPRRTPFLFGTGDQTIAFIPAICTMVFGTILGDLLRKPATRPSTQKLLLVGSLFVASGLLLALAVPIIKRIWTPSYGVFTTGMVLLCFALVYWIVDVKQRTSWTFVFRVVGSNSLLMYCMYMLLPKWYVTKPLRMVLGNDVFLSPYGAILTAFVALFSFWLVCFLLWRKGWFLSA